MRNPVQRIKESLLFLLMVFAILAVLLVAVKALSQP